ncbi:hypothetical protein Tco_0694469, partial [Tanacetum coccineum]
MDKKVAYIYAIVLNLFLKIILISSDNIISLESNNFKQSISSDDIVSSNGPSKALLKWYEDATDEDTEEFMFSKSGGRKKILKIVLYCEKIWSEKTWKFADKAKRKRK